MDASTDPDGMAKYVINEILKSQLSPYSRNNQTKKLVMS